MSFTYKFKTKPYRHQVQALKKLISTGFGGALLMEPRTGKTKVAIDYACVLKKGGKVGRVLVVCPVSVIGVWEEEIKKHATVKVRVLSWDRKARRKKPLPPYRQDVLDFVILNYDAFSTPGRKTRTGRRSRKGGRFAVRKELEAWAPHLLILDESHRIKTPSAKKTRMLTTLAKNIGYRVLMTGTVVTKKKRIFDVYAQWKVLNPKRFADITDDLGRANFHAFKQKFGVWTDRNGFPQWLRNRNTKLLYRRIHEDSYAITRDECFDLPPRVNQRIPVTLDKSWHAYQEMAEEMIHQLETGEITEARIKLTQILRLAQITAGLAKTEPSAAHPKGRLHRIGREKLQVMEELLSDLAEAEEKVVVASRFRQDLTDVEALCKRLKIKTYFVWGKQTRTERDQHIRQFREVDAPAVMLVQPQAAALGIDLSSAAVMIWYSLTNSYVDFTQCCDRIALSRRNTTFMYLLASGTVDELMYESLLEDKDVVDAITRSPQSLLPSVFALGSDEE